MKKIIIILQLFLISLHFAQSTNHPRILIYQEDLDAIRAKVWNNPGSLPYEYYQKMTTFNNYFLTHHVGSYDSWNFGIYGNMAFGYLIERAGNPALAQVWVDESIAYAINTIIPQIPSPPANWLERLKIVGVIRSLAIIYDYAYDELSSAEKQIFMQAINSGMVSLRNWLNSENYSIKYCNHIDCISSALGLAAIAIKGEDQSIYSDLEYTQDMLKIKSVLFDYPYGHYHRMYGLDGSTKEGPAYAQMHPAHINFFISALSKIEDYNWFDPPDQQYDFIRTTYKNRTEHFIFHLLPKRYHTYSYDDFSFLYYNDSVGPALYAMIGDYLMFAKIYNCGLSKWLYEQTLGSPNNLTRNTNLYGFINNFLLPIISYEEVSAVSPTSILSPEKYFSSYGAVFWRTGFEDENDLLFMFQSEPEWYSPEGYEPIVQGKHSQPDKGQFLLHAYGEWFIADTEDKINPWGNNYIVINESGDYLGEAHGYGGNSWWQQHGEITNYIESDLINYVSSDNTETFKYLLRPQSSGLRIYSPQDPPNTLTEGWLMDMQNALRDVYYIKQEGSIPYYFIVLDDIQRDNNPHEYNWLAHTRSSGNPASVPRYTFDTGTNPIKVKRSNGSAPEKYLDLYVGHPATFTRSTVTVDPIGEEELTIEDTIGCFNHDATFERLKITANEVNPYYQIILFPHTDGLQAPIYENIAINNGSCVTLNWNDYKDYSFFKHENDINDPLIITDAKSNFVREDLGNQSIHTYAMINGTKLIFKSTSLVDTYQEIANVIYDRSILLIVSDESIERLKAYAPDIEKIMTIIDGDTSYANFYRVNDYVYIGSIIEDQVWDGSVYLSGSIALSAGKQITVIKSTEIKFDQGSKLTVYGTLQLNGLIRDSIKISSLDGKLGYGIIIPFKDTPGTASINMEYCSIKNLSIGIESRKDQISVRNSTIDNCAKGISLINAYGLIEANYIKNCSYGIFVNSSLPEVHDNTIRHCSYNGIYILAGSGTYLKNTITECGYLEVPKPGGFLAIEGLLPILEYEDCGLLALNEIIDNLGFGIQASDNTNIFAGSNEELLTGNSMFNNRIYDAEALYTSTIYAMNN